jgi:restriction endonuclease S subunit
MRQKLGGWGMSSDVFRLDKLLEITSSKRIHLADYVPSGVPFLRGKEVIERAKGNSISTELFITHEKYREIERKFGSPQDGDILLTSVGTLGVAYFVEGLGDFYFKDGNVTWFRNFRETVVPKFLYYWLTSPATQKRFDEVAIGSTQRALTISALKGLEIALPCVGDQTAIVGVLDALSDRITLLRETNATLEAIAQALFKSWFVDFDPVHAPEGMDEATAALFPDSFEDSEQGLMPKGWSIISFRDSINVIGGGTPKTSVPEYWGDDIPWFSVVDAPGASDVFVVDTEKHITEAGLNGSSTKLLPTGTTIISARGTVGRLALTGCPMAMNQSCYGLRGKAGDQYFTYFSTTRLVAQLQQRAHGSVFDTITQETFAGVSLCYPEKEVIQAFEQLVEPLLMRIRENLIQANSLASLRDALLPRLISGQLPLTTAVEQVNA